jgi:hypothetical protein
MLKIEYYFDLGSHKFNIAPSLIDYPRDCVKSFKLKYFHFSLLSFFLATCIVFPFIAGHLIAN